jgi:hypothetical protein
MEVGYLQDSETVERFRKPRTKQIELYEFDSVWFNTCGVGEARGARCHKPSYCSF